MIFTNPLFLIALAAVALPIAVHLFNFRRYRKIYFSNVEYLEELQVETKRQSKLRELLVLAVRILAIVFLVLAFSQPVIPKKKSPLHAGASAVSIYVDNSFSMENAGRNGSLLEQAKLKAREIALAYQPSDQFQLITNDAEGIYFRWLSRDEFLSDLNDIEPSPSSTTLSVMATKQHDFLHSASTPNRFAYLLSDFQRSTADLASLPQDSLISTILVPLESVGFDNLSIDSVWFDTPVAMQGSQMVAHVLVANHGDKGVDDLPVKLYMNDEECAIGSVSLLAHSSQAVSLSFTVDRHKSIRCRVEIADYPITFDDHIFFSLNVDEAISALCIEGRPQPYVHRLFDGDSIVVFHYCSDRNIDFTHLSDYHCILLGELNSIPSGLAQTLSKQVEQGASLIVVPSDDADIDSYNSLLSLLQAPQLGPWKNETDRVSEVNVQSSLYRGVFSGNQLDASMMEMPTTQGHFKALQGTSTVTEAALTYPAGDLFLCTTPFRAGHTYLFTSPLQPAYGDFVQQALFVPTLYNMALYANPFLQIYTTLGSTNPILLPNTLTSEEGICHLVDADNTFDLIPDLRIQAGRTWLYPHGTVSKAGTYQLKSPNSSIGLSFNYPRQESDMSFLSPSEVQRAVRNNHLEHTFVVRHAQKPIDSLIRTQLNARPLWRWCVLLCLLCLAAEVAFIQWPSKRSQ